jgi:hypothetical protein
MLLPSNGPLLPPPVADESAALLSPTILGRAFSMAEEGRNQKTAADTDTRLAHRKLQAEHPHLQLLVHRFHSHIPAAH